MKAAFVAVAAAMAVGASALNFHPNYNHNGFHNMARHQSYNYTGPPTNASQGCGECGEYTVWVTTYGEATLYHPPTPPATKSVSYTTVTPTEYVVPTPFVTICPTPGIYTIPATTITLTESTTVCGATSTTVPAGEHTYGGVTTVVETATTVVFPYATVQTESNVVTSYIKTTTYVYPSAGTYTIAPLTATCDSDTVLVYPTPASYAPGTYIQPEVVTTVTETDYVVFCPYTSKAAPIPAPTHAAPAKPAYSAAAPPKTKPESYSGQSSYNLQGAASQWAITYTPYTQSGLCKDAAAVAADLQKIKARGFSTIRTYSTDCNGLETISAGCEAAGLRLIVGVFINESGCSGAQEQVSAIVAWKNWSIVDLIVIGNEAILSGFTTAGELSSFISSSKSAFRAAGYTGPCTTSETVNILQQHKDELCGVVDIVGANIHAFFNSDVVAPEAGSFVKSQLQILGSLCPGKSAINLESGWPNAGDQCNGAACPGKEQQYSAIKSIISECGSNSIIFSYEDDLWKPPGGFGIEQHWGLFESLFGGI